MTSTLSDAAAPQRGVTTSQEPSCTASGRALTEYGEIIADINRPPQMTALTWFRLLVAGQLDRPTKH